MVLIAWPPCREPIAKPQNRALGEGGRPAMTRVLLETAANRGPKLEDRLLVVLRSLMQWPSLLISSCHLQHCCRPVQPCRSRIHQQIWTQRSERRLSCFRRRSSKLVYLG